MKLFKSLSLFLFLSTHALAQKDIVFWTDTSTAYINHRVISMLEYKKEIYLLSKSQDATFSDPHPSFSRVSMQGKLQNFTVYPDVKNLYELNAMVVQPNEDLRIYGTCVSNGKFTPYINSVSPAGVMAANTFMMVNVSHFVGDAININTRECVWAKSIQGSANNKFNAYVYRVDMSKNDNISWKTVLSQEFNEECSRLVVLPDTSILLLCKRYTDESFAGWVPVIYKMDSKGNLQWTKELTAYGDFTVQNLTADENYIYYSNSMGNDKSRVNSGNIVRLDQQGEVVNRVAIVDMNPNGILVLRSGKILLYGGEYKTEGVQIVEKAKVTLFDGKLTKIKERVMGAYDKPDAELPGLVISMMPSSSDILTAIQLSDGRVALAGRVYMPLHTGADDILLSPRTNRNLLILTQEDGVW